MAYIARPRLIYGVGVNDVYLPNFHGTICYKKWQDVVRRCIDQKYIEKYPRYAGCVLDDRWIYLSAFKEWYETWENPDSKQIDKDILYPGNKIYGPDTCLMVNSTTNAWFKPTDIIKSKGDKSLPRGVSMLKGKFRAQINEIDGVYRKHLGCYNTAEEAGEAFDVARKKQIQILLERESDSRIKNALRQYL